MLHNLEAHYLIGQFFTVPFLKLVPGSKQALLVLLLSVPHLLNTVKVLLDLKLLLPNPVVNFRSLFGKHPTERAASIQAITAACVQIAGK